MSVDEVKDAYRSLLVGLFNRLSEKNRIKLLNDWTYEAQGKQITERFTEEAIAIANQRDHKKNCAVYMFASKLGEQSLCKLFDHLKSGVKPRKMVRLHAGFWIVIFETHEIAAEMITKGHGRLPFPDLFPYFNKKHCDPLDVWDDALRIDMSWAVRKSDKTQ